MYALKPSVSAHSNSIESFLAFAYFHGSSRKVRHSSARKRELRLLRQPAQARQPPTKPGRPAARQLSQLVRRRSLPATLRLKDTKLMPETLSLSEYQQLLEGLSISEKAVSGHTADSLLGQQLMHLRASMWRLPAVCLQTALPLLTLQSQLGRCAASPRSARALVSLHPAVSASQAPISDWSSTDAALCMLLCGRPIYTGPIYTGVALNPAPGCTPVIPYGLCTVIPYGLCTVRAPVCKF